MRAVGQLTICSQHSANEQDWAFLGPRSSAPTGAAAAPARPAVTLLPPRGARGKKKCARRAGRRTARPDFVGQPNRSKRPHARTAQRGNVDPFSGTTHARTHARAMRRLLTVMLLMTAHAQTDAPTPRPQTPPTDPTPKPTPSPSPRPRNWTPSPTRSPKPTLPPTLSFSPTFAPSPAPSLNPSAAPTPQPTPMPQTAAPTQKPIPEKFPFYFTVAGVEVMKTQITFLNSLCACVFVGGTLRHLYDSLWRPKMSLVEGGLRSNRRF